MFAYEKVYAWIKENIDSRRWEGGSRIPNEMDLVAELSVSRDTVRRALMRLTREGYIYRKPGYGTFVKHEKSDYRLGTLDSFTEQMKERGHVPSSDIIATSRGPLRDDRLRDILQVGPTDDVYIIERVRKADGVPMAFEVAHIPYAVCPDLEYHLPKYESLFALYENVYHHEIDFGRVLLEAAKCPEAIRPYLQLPRNEPVLTMNCTTYLTDQRPLYHVICHYSSQHYLFSTNIPRSIR
ncbi:MAG: GntR family transcriptional regulator [Planctomycetes bacterium]|nr:GntR family transcriptional regulator [Planctomycetota bacterium]